jgi:hypothetical protein
MKLNRRPQTTSRDTHRVCFIRGCASLRRILCARCDKQIQMLTIHEAAAAANVETQAIHTLVEAGKLHYVETNEAILVCLNSLISFRSHVQSPVRDD